jgi:16S rRNA (cytidine1402-2'-O)-methyltransferase
VEKGVLYVVATPIGNLEDISLRALAILKGVDGILAEDTRHSCRLLKHFGITTPLMAFHEHNERRRLSQVLEGLEKGQSLALISDAGTPLVSDPGYPLVRALRQQNRKVVPIPGPSALICGLSVAGLPTDRFVFEGFLPSRRQERRQRLEEIAGETRTLVLFEAPHRIRSTLHDLAQVLGGERQATVARELTKVFETIRTDSLAGLTRWLEEGNEQQRGEFVLIVQGAPKDKARALTAEQERTLLILLEELPLSQAVSLAARLTDSNRNQIYQRAVELRNSAEMDG